MADICPFCGHNRENDDIGRCEFCSATIGHMEILHGERAEIERLRARLVGDDVTVLMQVLIDKQKAEIARLTEQVREARGKIEMLVIGAPTNEVAIARAIAWLAANPEPGTDEK